MLTFLGLYGAGATLSSLQARTAQKLEESGECLVSLVAAQEGEAFVAQHAKSPLASDYQAHYDATAQILSLKPRTPTPATGLILAKTAPSIGLLKCTTGLIEATMEAELHAILRHFSNARITEGAGDLTVLLSSDLDAAREAAAQLPLPLLMPVIPDAATPTSYAAAFEKLARTGALLGAPNTSYSMACNLLRILNNQHHRHTGYIATAGKYDARFAQAFLTQLAPPTQDIVYAEDIGVNQPQAAQQMAQHQAPLYTLVFAGKEGALSSLGAGYFPSSINIGFPVPEGGGGINATGFVTTSAMLQNCTNGLVCPPGDIDTAVRFVADLLAFRNRHFPS